MPISYLFAASGIQNTFVQLGENFGFDKSLFLSQLISFAIVAFLLHRFAYKPILKVLAERRQRIAEGLANAEKIKSELARTEAARQEIMARANSEANRLIEEARAAASRFQEQESQKAIQQATEIIAKAKEAADANHARMLSELKREVGQLVVKTTVAVTGKVLTPEDQKRLAEETSRELAA